MKQTPLHLKNIFPGYNNKSFAQNYHMYKIRAFHCRLFFILCVYLFDQPTKKKAIVQSYILI